MPDNRLFVFFSWALALMIAIPIQLAAQETSHDPPRFVTRLAEIEIDQVELLRIGITIRTEFSPFDRSRYELRNQGRTLIVSLSELFVGDYGELQDVGLLSLDELPNIIADLEDCGVDELDEQVGSTEEGGLRTYQLDIEIDDYHRQAIASVEALSYGDPLLCAIQQITSLYDLTGEPIAFVNPFWDDGEYGWFETDSDPRAHLYLDGQDTGLTTPVYGLRLGPGVHRVRYVNLPLNIDREYEVTIVEGVTTRLNVELR